MKKMFINGEEYQAEKIIKTSNSILGYDGNSDTPSWGFKGIKDFSKFQLEEGQEFDVDEKEQLKQQVKNLENYILMQEGVI